jgi:hypothetical protein
MGRLVTRRHAKIRGDNASLSSFHVRVCKAEA